jgi:hypothetical protein
MSEKTKSFIVRAGRNAEREKCCLENNVMVVIFWKPYKIDSDMWHKYLFHVLLQRPCENYWMTHEDKLKLEKQYFSEE